MEMKKECKDERVKEAHKEKCILAPHLLQFSIKRQSFYKARKSTWSTMKNVLLERPTSTNIINKMSMPVLMEMKVFIKWLP